MSVVARGAFATSFTSTMVRHEETQPGLVGDGSIAPTPTVVQGTYQVRTVGSGDTVETKVVKVGPRIGARWVITEGLSAGTRVVVEGGPTPDGTAVTTRPFTPAPEAR